MFGFKFLSTLFLNGVGPNQVYYVNFRAFVSSLVLIIVAQIYRFSLSLIFELVGDSKKQVTANFKKVANLTEKHEMFQKGVFNSS